MPIVTTIDHSGQLRSSTTTSSSTVNKQNGASASSSMKKQTNKTQDQGEDEVETSNTGGDIWNHIILKQYYSDDGSGRSINSSATSSSENKSGGSSNSNSIKGSNKSNGQQQQQQNKSAVLSPPETSRPPATAATGASTRNKGSQQQQQPSQQKKNGPTPIPRPSGTNWNNRILPTGPPLTTTTTTTNNNTNIQGGRGGGSGVSPKDSNSSNSKSKNSNDNNSSHSHSSSSSSSSSSGGLGGVRHRSRQQITASSVANAFASKTTSNSSSSSSRLQSSSNINSRPPPPPPQIQPKQISLKSKQPPPITTSTATAKGHHHQRPKMQVQQLNRRVGLQQTRAMASIPNLSNWDDPKFQSPNSPKKPQKHTLGETLSNVVHNVVTPHHHHASANNNTRTAAAAAAAKANEASAQAATTGSDPNNQKITTSQQQQPPHTTNAHTGEKTKDESQSRFGFLGSIGFWYFVIWAAWLIGGTAFYGYGRKGQNLALGKAFYMAVNIGYSIGFGYPAEVDEGGYLWFSTFYVLVGSSLVAVALGFFADKIVEDADDWFINLLQKQEYKRKMTSSNLLTRISAWGSYHWEELRSIGVWIFWVLMMVMYSMIHIGWPVSQAQYFAISSCSTGGHWSIPVDSPDWFFGITGLVVAFGVPIMGVAMATIGQFIAKSKKKELEDIKDTINAPVTPQEIKMMQQFGLEDGDGEVDEAEFIILCMCRLGTDPRIIEYIGQRFRKLDVDGGGSLSMREIVGRDSLDDDMPLNDISEGDDEDESESTSNPI